MYLFIYLFIYVFINISSLYINKTKVNAQWYWNDMKDQMGKSRNRRTFSKIENLRFLQNYDDLIAYLVSN